MQNVWICWWDASWLLDYKRTRINKHMQSDLNRPIRNRFCEFHHNFIRLYFLLIRAIFHRVVTQSPNLKNHWLQLASSQLLLSIFHDFFRNSNFYQLAELTSKSPSIQSVIWIFLSTMSQLELLQFLIFTTVLSNIRCSFKFLVIIQFHSRSANDRMRLQIFFYEDAGKPNLLISAAHFQ